MPRFTPAVARETGAVAALFLLFFVLYFSPVLFDARLLAVGDATIQYLPMLLSKASLWNSNQYAGHPAFADPQSLIFSPLRLAFGNYNVGTTAGKSNGAGKLPTMRNPYVQNWTFGIQRELAKDTLLEVRYAGNKVTHKWKLYNIQEVNIFENGFLAEFQNAQHNLEACTANRTACTGSATGALRFDNRGLPGQVALPIFDAAFGPLGSQPALALV